MERQASRALLFRLGLGVAWGAALLAAAPVRAASHVQSIPGASCVTDGTSSATWDYRASRLVNTGTGAYDVVFAVCAVSLYSPGAEPQEYRLMMRDAEARDSWCQVYTANGTLARTHYTTGASPIVRGSLGSPLGGPEGRVEATFHCLVQSGASIDKIEIVWWRP